MEPQVWKQTVPKTCDITLTRNKYSALQCDLFLQLSHPLIMFYHVLTFSCLNSFFSRPICVEPVSTLSTIKGFFSE